MAMQGDTYAQALQSRRGKTLDPGTLGVGANPDQINSDHKGIDSRLGVDGSASAGGEAAGGKGTMGATPFDWRSPDHMDQHTSPLNENRAPSPAHDWRSPQHGDEHTPAKGESTQAAPMPLAQSPGMGGGDLGNQIRDIVGGHASQNEYDQLKGMKPRSLGERAKMDALRSKFSPAGSGQNG